MARVRSLLLPWLHNSLSHSPKSARRDHQAEKRNQAATENVSVIYSNPGSRFYVIIGMISQLAHSGQQAIIPLVTHLHTHTHTHAFTHSLYWMRWQKKYSSFTLFQFFLMQNFSSVKLIPLSKPQSVRAQIRLCTPWAEHVQMGQVCFLYLLAPALTTVSPKEQFPQPGRFGHSQTNRNALR